MLQSKVVEIKEVADGLVVKIENKDKQIEEKHYDYVLMSIGRKPQTGGLGLENTKVQVNERGWIIADNTLKTSDDSIYAIGDIVGEPMLAHKASHEGRVAVDAISGKKVAFEPLAIPAVVFTDPELAWAGITENQANAKGINFVMSKFPWAASGRATTLDRNDGLTKLIIDPETERILGIGICGPGAGEKEAPGLYLRALRGHRRARQPSGRHGTLDRGLCSYRRRAGGGGGYRRGGPAHPGRAQ